MLNSWWFLTLVGGVLGFLAGLGVGGGSLLMIWLTQITGMAHTEARCINLLFFLPCALISSIFRWKQGSLNLKNLLPAVIAGCVSAAVFSFLGATLNNEWIKKLFGGLLLVTGLRELLYRPAKPR